MRISEKMDRNDPQDQIEIGNIVEVALKGSFGQVLRSVIEGMKDEYLILSESSINLPADRSLGRIESLSKLQDRLDYIVSIGMELQKDVRETRLV